MLLPAIFILVWVVYHHRNATISAKSSDQKSDIPLKQFSDGVCTTEKSMSSLDSAALEHPEPVLPRKSTLRAPRLDSDSNDNAQLNSGRFHISNTLPSPASDLANADPSSAEAESGDIQFQPSPRASGHRSLLHPFRRSQYELQVSDADEMLPVAAKATRKSPYRGRKRNAEEEVGVHVWEKNGNLVLEVPWFQGKMMGV